MLIQWGKDRQRVWVEPQKTAITGRSAHKWVVIVHGGAWRDPKITMDSAKHLIPQLSRSEFGGVASVDYRLSPSVQHPAHLEDVIGSIMEIKSRFHVTEIVMVGHSCGAFLCGQVCEALPQLVTHVVTVEGIYNLQLLIDEYPDYIGFVRDAFGSQTSQWPVIDWARVPIRAIVHSKEDELLSLVQPNWLAEVTGVEIHLLKGGKHDEVYEQLSNEWSHLIN